MYASVQVCKYASMHICKYAHMHICTYMQVCTYASMQVCMYSSMQVCKYASVQVWEYASIQVCKYTHVYIKSKITLPSLKYLKLCSAYKQGQRKMSTVNGRVKIKISQREDTKMSSFCIKWMLHAKQTKTGGPYPRLRDFFYFVWLPKLGLSKYPPLNSLVLYLGPGSVQLWFESGMRQRCKYSKYLKSWSL